MIKALSIQFLLLGVGLSVFSQAKKFDFPNPVDTRSKPIVLQERGIFNLGSEVFADNDFKSARLNSIEAINDSVLLAFIAPENKPINPSPWYAFRLWSSKDTQKKLVKITYPDSVKHRYWPKISRNGDTWLPADSSRVMIAADTSSVSIFLEIPTDTVWVAAQPIVSSSHVQAWCKKLATSNFVDYASAGKSTGKREIPFVQISIGKTENKKIVVLLSRQHPPEVTGYLALQSFVERILDGSELSSSFLDEYVVLIYPLLNPDGVDEGHWRHNLGGIDLNRDWSKYRQKEIRTVANHIVKTARKMQGEVVLGLDFHSTYYDVYYTTDRQLTASERGFTDPWLDYIRAEIPNYDPRDAPSGLGAPVSKGWFISQFNANGITYEIGDTTPPDFIKQKAKISAEGMMKVLLKDVN